MTRENMARILGAVYSLTYSLYPIEMREERNALVRRALTMTAEDPSEREIDQLLFEIGQSKIALDPGCQCMIGHGYYPDDFTDGLRKLEREDADGQAARAVCRAAKAGSGVGAGAAVPRDSSDLQHGIPRGYDSRDSKPASEMSKALTVTNSEGFLDIGKKL